MKILFSTLLIILCVFSLIAQEIPFNESFEPSGVTYTYGARGLQITFNWHN